MCTAVWRTDQGDKLDRKQGDECFGEGTGGRCHLQGGMAVDWRGVDRTEGALGGTIDRIWYAGVDKRDGQDNLRLSI